MTIDYQLSLLSYLVQCPEGLQYIEELDDSLFDLAEDKLTLQILKKYYKTYQALPSKTVALQYTEEQIAQTPSLSKELAENLRNNIEDIYIPLVEGDRKNIQDSIIDEIQLKTMNKTFMDLASNKISPTQVFAKLNRLASLNKSSSNDVHADGGFLVQDRHKHFDEQVEGNPTFLHDLNRLTAAGGFYSPQLIVFLSGPKSFKTGILLKLGIEYARGGMRVYYADNENGARSLRNRAKQTIMECELQDLYDPALKEELDDTLYRFGHYMGGDLFIDSYLAYASTISDVRARLAYLKEKHKWVPDIIIYDTIDKFSPSNPADQKRDLRIQIQKVYDEAINLNKEYQTFSFAPSQVNRNAIGKKVFDMRDLAEDFAKAFNCHAAFAICSTDQEIEEGIRRIIPVVQREGVAYKGKNLCVIEIDEKKQIIKELDKDDYLQNLQDD